MHLVMIQLIGVFMFFSVSSVRLNEVPGTFSNSILQMTANIYQEEVKHNGNQNVVLSPLGAHIAMSMLFHGARGNSRKQLKSALGLDFEEEMDHLDDVEHVMARYNSLNDDNVTVDVANAMFVTDDLQMKATYKMVIENQFDSFIDTLNFTETNQAVHVINNWAANKTNDKITEIVSEKNFDQETRMVLLNAVYFKAKWLQPFEAKNTRKGFFSTPNKEPTKVDYMFLKEKLNSTLIEDLGATLLALPYIDTKLTMMILLPESNYTVEDLEFELFQEMKVLNIQQYTRQLIERRTDLLFPKFEVEGLTNLGNHFRKLGVTDIFDDKANLKGISEGNDVRVDNIVQKSKIKVTEEGSEAAAVTVVDSTKLLQFLPNLEISVNRPFIFFILDATNQVPIFMGKIVDLEVDGNK